MRSVPMTPPGRIATETPTERNPFIRPRWRGEREEGKDEWSEEEEEEEKIGCWVEVD